MQNRPSRGSRQRARGGKPAPDKGAGGVPVVGVGASVFGLHACSALLACLPEDLGMAVVLVPQVPADHFTALTAYLGTVTSLPVQALQGEVPLRANTIFVVPPGRAFVCAGEHLRLAPPANPDAPAGPIDTFFWSLAKDCSDRAIGVLLSGTKSDGIRGLQAIKQAGGATFADQHAVEQDHRIPESPAVRVMGAEDIGEELVRVGRSLFTPAGSPAAADRATLAPEEDLHNLLASLPLAVVLTGRDRRLRRFSRKAAELFGLSDADLGGPFPPVPGRLYLAGLVQAIGIAMDSGVAIESVACNHDDRWFSLTIRPCRARDGQPMSEGAVIILTDLQAFKEGERSRRAALSRASHTFNAVRDPLLILDEQLRVREANDAFCCDFRLDRQSLAGKTLSAIAQGSWDGAKLDAALATLLHDQTAFDDVEVRGTVGSVPHVLLAHGRPLSQLPDDPHRILLGFDDVTVRRRVEAGRSREAKALLVAQEFDRRVLPGLLPPPATGANGGSAA